MPGSYFYKVLLRKFGVAYNDVSFLSHEILRVEPKGGTPQNFSAGKFERSEKVGGRAFVFVKAGRLFVLTLK